jgi:hypothetical protein
MWSVEELRKRSKELNLLEVADLVTDAPDNKGSSPVEKKENERSPSKSSNSGSQVRIRVYIKECEIENNCLSHTINFRLPSERVQW